jgi:putative CocE/NonD family hydrolase
MSDGTRLAARMWLPEDAEENPVPAILEYIPYRKGDAFAQRDTHHHPYFAGYGYAAVRLDLRGSGDSDGIMLDEYLPLEQDDGVEAIAWLAEQPWCTGKVGMIGISWGGFNGLQIAARRPPELGAVVSMCASDDRYSDDVHYVGGCVLGVDMLAWAATMLTLCAMPPDPSAVGEGWHETWMARMQDTPAMVEAWLTHQRRDEYWGQGSVCEDYAAIEAPVYAVGGWADGYSNAIPRLIEGLPGPKKGLIGPWSHAFPQDGEPGPTIGFLQECLRWFDHWLKGIDNGITEEPVLRAWMQDIVAPATHYAERPGRWVTEEAWPPPGYEEQVWSLQGDFPLEHRSVASTGADGGAWCPDGGEGDWPAEQSAEDERSLTFTLEPLEQDLEILGFPEVELALSMDRPQALLAVRLNAVAPDGASLLITRGLLNLTHRESHADPEPLEPGRRYDVRVRLDAIAQAIPAARRLRVAISTVYWPWAWPSPEPATLTLHEGRLLLPVRPARDEPEPPPFGPPEWAQPLAAETIEPGRSRREHRFDRETGLREIEFEWNVGGHRRLVEAGTEMLDTNVTIYRITDHDPTSAEVEVHTTTGLGRGEWQTRVETESRMSSTTTEFMVSQLLKAFEGGEQVYSRAWELKFPRDNV